MAWRAAADKRSRNEVTRSKGVDLSNCIAAATGTRADITGAAADSTFMEDGLQTRRNETRQTPTVIHTVFSSRNVREGRATDLFDGVSPFGAHDTHACVYKTGAASTIASPETVHIDNASLATGTALNQSEMSTQGRNWPQAGARLQTALERWRHQAT